MLSKKTQYAFQALMYLAEKGKEEPVLIAEIAKNPKDVPLAQIMRLLDGPISLLPCVSLYFYERCKNCDQNHCGLHIVMSQVRDANLKILEKKTIADLAKR